MDIRIYRNERGGFRFPRDAEISLLLEDAAADTDVRGLSVVLYLPDECDIWQGEFIRNGRVGHLSLNDRNKFAGSRPLLVKADGRDLIRMIIGDKWLGDGKTVDLHGVRILAEEFRSLLGLLFIHELYHYPRLDRFIAELTQQQFGGTT